MIKAKLNKTNEKLSTKCISPMKPGYHPKTDTSEELNGEKMRYLHKTIRILRWEIEIVLIKIILEVSLLPSHLVMPRRGHMQQLYHIFGYLNKRSRTRLLLDTGQTNISEDRFFQLDQYDFYKGYEDPIPLDVTKPRGNPMSIHVFMDLDHTRNKVTQRSQSDVLIFCNMSPVL